MAKVCLADGSEVYVLKLCFIGALVAPYEARDSNTFLMEYI